MTHQLWPPEVGRLLLTGLLTQQNRYTDTAWWQSMKILNQKPSNYSNCVCDNSNLDIVGILLQVGVKQNLSLHKGYNLLLLKCILNLHSIFVNLCSQPKAKWIKMNVNAINLRKCIERIKSKLMNFSHWPIAYWSVLLQI